MNKKNYQGNKCSFKWNYDLNFLYEVEYRQRINQQRLNQHSPEDRKHIVMEIFL